MSRPEHSHAPNIFYDEAEAKKYSTSSRMLSIQKEITSRAIELLNLGNAGPKLILDVGCGSGLSGQVIGEHGHTWIGLDISPSMLQVARQTLDEQEAKEQDDDEDEDDSEGEDGMNEEDDEEEMDDDEDEEEDEDMEDDDEEGPVMQIRSKSSMMKGTGDLMLHDMGQGINFRPNSFDGCISISAVQWLCYSYDKSQVPQRRLRAFFSSLYTVLRRGSRAVIQLYPETPQQMEMITNAAMAAGFTGGVVVDYPNSAKAKKFYLVLFAGGSSASSGSSSNQLPRGLGSSSSRPQTSIEYETHRGKKKQGRVKKRDNPDQPAVKSRDWVLKKKDRQRKQGKEVRVDSKYSGRRRKPKF